MMADQVAEPQLQRRVTDAIREAFFAELADAGYGRMSVDSIVRRAGVGKAAVYRRWPTKRAMAVALLTEVAAHAEEPPDTGSLRDDLTGLVNQLVAVLEHPLVSRVLPAVAAEVGRDAELKALLHDTVEGPRRASQGRVIRRAMERDEVPLDSDVDLALDALVGPIYWRLLVRRKPLTPDLVERLVDGVLGTLATPRSAPLGSRD